MIKNKEPILWRGRTSPLLHIWLYFFSAILALMLSLMHKALVFIPLAICAWNWIRATSEHYELTPTSLLIHSGRGTEEVAISAIKDMHVLQPFIFKLLGRSTVLFVIDEEAEYHPCVICIPDADQLMSKIQTLLSANSS